MQSARGNTSRKGVYVAPDGGEGIPQERVEVLYAEYKADGTSKRRREDIRNQLVMAYQSAIKTVARKFSRTSHRNFDDLVQEANVAVLRAFGNYDPARGEFSTFVAFQAECAMKHYTACQHSAVNLTGSKPAKQVMYALMRAIAAKHGFLTSRDIDLVAQETQHRREQSRLPGQRLNCSVQEVQDVLWVLQPSRSMSSPVAHQDDLELQDLLFEADGTPEDIAATEQVAAITAAALQKALDTLSERELDIVSRRRLSNGKPTLTEIGKEQGVSTERIRQVEARALQKVRLVLQKELAEVL